MAIVPRSLWSDVARDLVLSRMPQHGPSELRVTLEHVLIEYGMTLEEGLELFQDPEFEELLDQEKMKASDYGSDAAHTYMVRDMVIDFSVRLHKKMTLEMDKLEPKDLLKYYEVVLKAAGWLEARKPRESAAELGVTGNGVQVQVQVINVPQLSNPKLNHLTAGAKVIDAEGYPRIEAEQEVPEE